MRIKDQATAKVPYVFCRHCFKATPETNPICQNNGCGRPHSKSTLGGKEVITKSRKPNQLAFGYSA